MAYLNYIPDLLWLVFLILILSHFYRRLSFLNQTKSWLITKGRITDLTWTDDHHRLWPKIKYTYTLIDNHFSSEYLFLDTTFNSPYSRVARQVAYQAAIAFKNNEDIDVYYNPANPKQAALNINIPFKLKAIVTLLAFLITSHLGVLLYHFLLS